MRGIILEAGGREGTWLASRLIPWAIVVFLLWPGAMSALFPPTPFKDVRLVSLEKIDQGYRLIARFEKVECDFDDLFVFGQTPDGLWPLPWQNTHDQFSDPDRVAGAQKIDITALPELELSAIEVRTRHDCDGEKTDRHFGTFEVMQ